MKNDSGNDDPDFEERRSERLSQFGFLKEHGLPMSESEFSQFFRDSSHDASENLADWNLLRAVKENRAELVRGLLQKSDSDANAKDDDGTSLLHTAAEGNFTDVGQLLVDYGADINAKIKAGDFQPIHVAIMTNSIDMLWLLIDAGADIEAPASHGIRPLHLASIRNSPEIARILIESGCDIESQIDVGHTALDIAIEKENFEVVEFLRSQASSENELY